MYEFMVCTMLGIVACAWKDDEKKMEQGNGHQHQGRYSSSYVA